MSERVEFHPPRDEGRIEVAGPILGVTLLEDRAQVRRVITARLEPGTARLRVEPVAPTVQDVSLTARAEAGAARVADVRVRRAMRVRIEDRPEEVAAIEGRAKEIRREFEGHAARRRRAVERYLTLSRVAALGVEEVPEDAAWGKLNAETWRSAFETVFTRQRDLRKDWLERYHQQQDLTREIRNLDKRRAALDTPSARFSAWLELDVVADEATEARIAVEYTVPNALWRPVHSAELDEDGRLALSTRAAVWQNTGEDWDGVELTFSTARTSLGTEPPLLSDDLLEAQRKSDEVRVEARQVAIQKARVEGAGAAAAAPSAVALPGVDDGGDVQSLVAEGRFDVPSSGRPSFVPLGGFTAEPEAELVTMPELEEKAFFRATVKNGGAAPLLAGPVELIRGRGFVGWTRLLFVAPGEPFELSFGPDPAVRVTRVEREDTETSPVDRWRHTTTTIRLYLSNLSGEPKSLAVKERIPVSEIEHVKVTLDQDETTGTPSLTDDGIATWRIDLEPLGHRQLVLAWTLSVAPDVQGL